MSLPRHIVLSSGDVVIDVMTSESGILIMRFDVMAALGTVTDRPVWAWDILWAGSAVMTGSQSPRRSAYTEEGLQHLIFEGVFSHIK
jgi:hypothetical protein